jgi:hypothetical protein
MPSPRPTPFDLVFQDSADSVFPSIRQALEAARQDPRDRDAFLMIREVITLVRDLRPDEGLGEGIDQLAALIHHAFLFWAAGQPTVEIPADQLPALLSSDESVAPAGDLQASYVQLPLRRVWAEVVPGEPPEPLDGCFLHQADASTLRVLGVFGIHPDRPGFSVVEVTGPRPLNLARRDQSPLFSPVLPGGARAGLFSVIGGEELLELGWRLELGARSWQPESERHAEARDSGLQKLPTPSS